MQEKNAAVLSELHRLVLQNDLGQIEQILSETDLRCARWSRWENRAPLHIAAAAGRNDIILLFVQAGIDVNVKTQDCWPATALHFAVCGKRKSTVEFLLKLGADSGLVGVVAGFKGNSVQLAAHKSFKEIENILLER